MQRKYRVKNTKFYFFLSLLSFYITVPDPIDTINHQKHHSAIFEPKNEPLVLRDGVYLASTPDK